MVYFVCSSRGKEACCVVIVSPSTEYVSLMTWSILSEQIVYVSSPDSKKCSRTLPYCSIAEVSLGWDSHIPSRRASMVPADSIATLSMLIDANRWDEKAGLRRDAVGSQVIDVLEAQEIKETGNEEG